MLVLGIESSCDDTAAAVVADGSLVRSSIVSSQDEVHARYGGVVPELASRRHIEAIIPVTEEALRIAGATLEEIDGIAVTQGPGLVGSILVGLSFARALAYTAGIPFTGINHIIAHPFAAFLNEPGESRETPRFPFVSLVASGGHTTLLLMEDFTRYRVLGQTLDDAAGEAFDKAAKFLGLGYPGGAAIDRAAREGDRLAIGFPRPYIAKANLDFSFSGIKTAVINLLRDVKSGTGLTPEALQNLAASFQEAVVDVLTEKARWALDATGVKDLVVAGGVACNSRLRERLKEMAETHGARLFIPPPRYCSDNAATVAALGYHQLRKGEQAPLDMNAVPSWKGF